MLNDPGLTFLHRHGDAESIPMEDWPRQDAAEHDPERAWPRGADLRVEPL